MNRIAGIFNFDQSPVARRQLEQMTGVMKLQVQETPQLFIDGEVGLGCIVIGNKREAWDGFSPCIHPNQQLVTVIDGRIDNRQELYASVEPEFNRHGKQIVDEDIILGAYKKWGLDFPKHLIGDFSIVIWDKSKRRLVCVRSHLGVKPFYYASHKGSFLFGSTPLAILFSGMMPPRIYEERIADLLIDYSGINLEAVDKTCTFYEDVFRLPPAHMLIVQASAVTLDRYWELAPVVNSFKTDFEYVEAFKELFMDAVRCRLLDGAVPASMLSGGIDSSAVVAMGRKICAESSEQPIHAFAVTSNFSPKNKEVAHIFSVVNQGGFTPHLISQNEIIQRMNEILSAIENETDPFDILMNLNRSVYLHARDQNVSVLLDGLDGDVLLSDAGCLLYLWRKAALWTILEETLWADGLIAEYKVGPYNLRNSLYSAMAFFAPRWLHRIRRQYRDRNGDRFSRVDSIISREFAMQVHLKERIAQRESQSNTPLSINPMEFHKNSLNHPFLTAALERYERASSAFGIDVRHPFTDIRLIEFCLGLPWQLKTRHGWTKMILRRAMEPYLPPNVVWRRDKESLMWEVNSLLLKKQADYFYQITCDEKENLEQFIDMHLLMKFWQEYLVFGDEKHANLIWSGISLAFWLRRHRNMVRDLRLQQ